jgi:glycolate oxidase iron-sulfur subunit
MGQEYDEAKQIRIAALADKVLDVSQFVAERVGLRPGGPEGAGDKVPITFHDPCHLKKSLGVAAQPRDLLRANPRYELKEMAEADWCCGCGGSFNLQHYEISAAIGRRKRENVLRSGAGVVATGCPACMLQLADMLSQAGARVMVKHAAEVYAETLSRLRE